MCVFHFQKDAEFEHRKYDEIKLSIVTSQDIIRIISYLRSDRTCSSLIIIQDKKNDFLFHPKLSYDSMTFSEKSKET